MTDQTPIARTAVPRDAGLAPECGVSDLAEYLAAAEEAAGAPSVVLVTRRTTRRVSACAVRFFERLFASGRPMRAVTAEMVAVGLTHDEVEVLIRLAVLDNLPGCAPMTRALMVLGPRAAEDGGGYYRLDGRRTDARRVVAAANEVLAGLGRTGIRYPGVAA